MPMQKFFVIYLAVLGLSSQLRAENISYWKVRSSTEIEELSDHEIAGEVWVDYKGKIKKEEFFACLPRESKKFPKDFAAFLKEFGEKIFIEKEFEDLKACKPGDCKFNFKPDEQARIKKARAQNKPDDTFKQIYFRYFQNRAKGKTELSEKKTSFFIRSSEKAFNFCKSKELDQLLQSRPDPKQEFRLANVRYSTRMRPTTRLTQTRAYSVSPNKHCFAEALIFSDHYDVEKIDIWRMHQKEAQEGEIRLVVRHRLDFLTTFWRRLQKGGLRKALIRESTDDIQELVDCINKLR